MSNLKPLLETSKVTCQKLIDNFISSLVDDLENNNQYVINLIESRDYAIKQSGAVFGKKTQALAILVTDSFKLTKSLEKTIVKIDKLDNTISELVVDNYHNPISIGEHLIAGPTGATDFEF